MDITTQQLEGWVERAKAVSARLSNLGIPTTVDIKYASGNVVELQFHSSPLAQVAVFEMLAQNIEVAIANAIEGDEMELN